MKIELNNEDLRMVVLKQIVANASIAMNSLAIFLMCFLTFCSIVLICGVIFGWRYISKKRDESVKEFKEKRRIKL